MIRGHDSIIVQTLTSVLVPIVQIYAVYILLFGQYSPGGGFAAGVIFGASVILPLLVFGFESHAGASAERVLRADGLGLLIFAAIGGLCMIAGGEYLNYASLGIPGLSVPERRSLGILLTQLGVGIDIAITAVSIVLSLTFTSHQDVSND